MLLILVRFRMFDPKHAPRVSTSSSLVEKDLLRLIAAGDTDAFTTLFHMYRVPLFDYALKITKTVPAAEELVQDSFLKIWLYRDRLPDVDSARHYIFGILKNASLDWLRRLALDRNMQRSVAAALPGFGDYTWEDVQLGETRRILDEAMERLSPQQREVFILSRYEGLSYAEIAVKMGISANTVRNHLVKALKFMREWLAREYGAAVLLILTYFFDKR